jgi:hypothetical protein
MHRSVREALSEGWIRYFRHMPNVSLRRNVSSGQFRLCRLALVLRGSRCQSAFPMQMKADPIETALPIAAEPAVRADSFKAQVQGLIDEAQAGLNDNRRIRDRVPIPYTFRLIPIDREGNLLPDEATTIVGRDLSLTGIGFSHDHAIPYKRAIISLDHPKVGRFAVEAEIVWTRPTPIGLFESGCRLLRTVSGHMVAKKG